MSSKISHQEPSLKHHQPVDPVTCLVEKGCNTVKVDRSKAKDLSSLADIFTVCLKEQNAHNVPRKQQKLNKDRVINTSSNGRG